MINSSNLHVVSPAISRKVKEITGCPEGTTTEKLGAVIIVEALKNNEF